MTERGRLALVSVHTSPTDPPGTGDAGGMNVYLAELSRQLVRIGWQVDVLTRRTDPAQPAVRTLPDGVRLRHLDAGPADDVPKSELTTLVGEFAGAASDLAREARYDVVHSHYWLSGVAGLAVAAACGAPHVLNLHTVAAMKNAALAPGDTPEPPARLRWEADLVAASAVTVTGTAAERATLLQAYGADPARTVLVPPGVDLTTFTPQRRGAARPAGDRPYLAMVARVQPLKGHDIAVEALALLPSGRRPALVLAGEASPGHEAYLAALRQRVAELGLTGDVVFLPAQQRTATADLLAGAELLLAPSRSETFGLITLEAAASGTPTVAADVAGLAEAVADGRSGVLVRGFAPAGWARAVDALLQDDPRRTALGRSARRYAEGFGWPQVAASVDRLYRDVLGRRPAA